MSQPKYTPPYLDLEAFNCPLPGCGVFAQQSWTMLNYRGAGMHENLAVSMCKHCGGQLLWWDDQILYPEVSSAPPPNIDMRQDIQDDYREAAAVVNKSPRSAAALLRLCIQKLNVQLGQPGKDINADIKALVHEGLDVAIQEALDSVRVVGNHAVHPGTIDIRDDAKTAVYLFRLVNFIADQMITQPKMRAEFYATKLPKAERDKIAKRDAKKSSGPPKPSR